MPLTDMRAITLGQRRIAPITDTRRLTDRMTIKLSTWAVGAFILTGGCAASQSTKHDDIYWAPPETGSYWVPEGTEVSAIIQAATACGARIDGGVFHHIPVPPGFARHGFHFVDENSLDAKKCTQDRIRSVPALSARSRTTP